MSDPASVSLFIGVDGGASRCRVRVRDAAGVLRAEIEGGNANVYLDFPGAIATIAQCIDQSLALVRDTGPATGVARLGLGLAGVSSPEAGARVEAALARYGRVVVAHDAEAACLGAHAGRDGGLIIAGTGSAAVARVGGASRSLGGRGFIMGDEGSGGRLGLEALRRALRAHDDLEPHTPLTRHLMQGFDNDPIAVIEWGRTARSSGFGTFAPVVCDYAGRGDVVAGSLVAAAAAAIDDMAAALVRVGAQRLAFVGGLSAALVPSLAPATRARLHAPLYDALEGALFLAGSPVPTSRPA